MEKVKNIRGYRATIRKPGTEFRSREDDSQYVNSLKQSESGSIKQTVTSGLDTGERQAVTSDNSLQKVVVNCPEQQITVKERREKADSVVCRFCSEEQEIRKPVNSFQNGTASQMKDSKEQERTSAGKELKKQENELAELYEKPCINDIIDAFIEQKIFMCMNGKRLFIKEDGTYASISISLEFELMKMKDLLKKNGMKLKFSDYSVIIRHLKTEPEIWVKDLEADGTGKYDIVFHDGSKLSGVEGEFSDFVVQGQIKNKLKPFTEGILLFVTECCVIEGNARTESTKLFGAYENFMYEYPDFLTAKLNQFVPYLKKIRTAGRIYR